jgi:hypothetical protein
MKEVKNFGSQLFDALMRDQVAMVYEAARAAAEEKDRGLRITLLLSGAPELMRLPWEFLYQRPRFLSQSIRSPVVRSLDLATASRPRRVRPPLRILGMVSSPSGYPELDTDDERRKLEKALHRLREDGLVELEWLDHATLADFGRRISEPDDIHVLHFIGHGAYDEGTEDGILVLETSQGRADDVSGEDLGAMLQDEDSLRLVVLNSCEGARTSHVDPFSGVATSLMQFGIPAVIGMQFEITDEAAIAFSDSLYNALAQGLPIDAALAPARRAIVGVQKEAEFGTPVLFLVRGASARLFDIERSVPEKQLHRKPEPAGARKPPAGVPTVEPTAFVPTKSPLRSSRRIRWLVVAAVVLLSAGLAGLAGLALWPKSGTDNADRDSVPTTVKINFQSPDAATPRGYLADFGQAYGPRTGSAQGEGLRYGWVHEGTIEPLDLIAMGRDRNRPGIEQRLDTLMHMEGWDPASRRAVPGAWEIGVPNGQYAVTVSVGDMTRNSRNTINVEGVNAIRDFRGTPDEDYQENTVQTTVRDGRLTVDSIGGDNTKINYVVVVRMPD